jgi:DNA-binding MltR family transcriptional regulator
MSNKKSSQIIGGGVPGEWAMHYERSMSSESTRAKVVLSACYLEELLGQLLLVVLAKNTDREDPLFDGPTAPLGNFSAKIEFAYRLAVISKENRTSLHLIRRIRNRFAHSITDCTFSDRKIKSWNEQLHSLNDIASPETRSHFPEGPVGDFEKSVSWLVYWLKHTMMKIPTECPHCGSEMEHRQKLREALPGDKH